jgi:cystathionine gamma-synthase
VTNQERPKNVVRRTPFPESGTTPLVPPIVPSAVFVARDADHMNDVYEGRQRGFTYARESSPNAELLAAKIAALEGADAALITSSGMSAIAAILLGLLNAGDHIVAGDQLYGRTLRLATQDLPRLGFSTDLVDPTNLAAVERAIRPSTKLIVVEVVSNPLLRVVDIAALARVAAAHGARLIVDNTFPTPLALQPLKLGAHVVFHSITKMLAGHSDVTLGAVCAARDLMAPIRDVVVTWGLTASAFDCWLAERGMNTLELRVTRAAASAAALADVLAAHPAVHHVLYPGRTDHPDHETAVTLFGRQFGNMVTFELNGGRDAVNRFMRALESIPFAPTLGDVATIISHPAVTSHRGLTADARDALGIREGTIRVSVGVEAFSALADEFRAALDAIG